MAGILPLDGQDGSKPALSGLDEELRRTILMGHPSRYDTELTVDPDSGQIKTSPIAPTQGSVSELVKRGANPNAVQQDGTPILMLAIQYGNFSAAKALIEGGANIKVENAHRMNPFQLTCQVPGVPVDLLELMIRSGADINEGQSETGLTPLMFSVMSDNRAAVQFLLEHGANPSQVNQQGKRALTLARENNLDAMEQLLSRAVTVKTTVPVSTQAVSNPKPETTPSPVSQVELSGVAITSNQDFFLFPSDAPISTKIVPPELKSELVAKVGEGGVTKEEFERAKLSYASGLGRERAGEVGYSNVEVKLTPQEESNALWMAVDEELLFQGALDDGAMDQEINIKRIRSEWMGIISALPEVKSNVDEKQRDGAVRFRSMIAPDLKDFTEEQIKNYYQKHPEYFQSPVKVRVKHISYPASADEEGHMATRILRDVIADPEKSTEWQGDEWVTEGSPPVSVYDGSLEYDLPKLFRTPKGGVSPILRGVVNLYVFWVIDRVESSGLRGLDEVRDQVLFRMAQERMIAYRDILNKDPDRFYRMALHRGIHRRIKGEIGSRFLTKFYNPPPGRKPEDVMAELKTKYPVEVLLKEAVFAKDQRVEYRRQKSDEEIQELMGDRFPVPGQMEEVPSSEIPVSWNVKSLIPMGVFVVVGGGLVFFLLRYFRS